MWIAHYNNPSASARFWELASVLLLGVARPEHSHRQSAHTPSPDVGQNQLLASSRSPNRSLTRHEQARSRRSVPVAGRRVSHETPRCEPVCTSGRRAAQCRTTQWIRDATRPRGTGTPRRAVMDPTMDLWPVVDNRQAAVNGRCPSSPYTGTRRRHKGGSGTARQPAV